MAEPTPTNLDRRNWFATTAALAAGVAMVADICEGADNPAANVADNGSDIKITGLRAVPVGGYLFIRIDTNKGVFGWGETAGIEPQVGKLLAESLFSLLDGENPTRIEYLWQKIYRAHRDIRGGPFMVHTLSAIDMALWDITGKLWGVPVYRLLGGPTRDKIRYYSHDKAWKAPPHGIYEHSGKPVDMESMKGAIAAARNKVGPDGTVMFDAHCAVPPATLIQFAAAIEPYDVLFIEEVAVPGNIDVFKRLKESIKIPLATGERDRTIFEFIPYLTERCIDILQPDVSHTGGISQMKKIATLAETYFVPLAPHCTNTQLGISASIHAIAAIPLFLIHEAYPGHTPEGLMEVGWKTVDGYITLPEGPGLGVTMNEAKLDELSKDPKYKEWKWPVYGRLKDGSIADY
jgi:galactonate dehydratase